MKTKQPAGQPKQTLGRTLDQNNQAHPLVVVLLLVVIGALVGGFAWLGWRFSEADRQWEHRDQALDFPAFHPGDPGVIDLRKKTGFEEALRRPWGKQSEKRKEADQ